MIPRMLRVRRKTSENVKSPHQLLARFHRQLWVHPAEHFFPTFAIHCCEIAHELVPRFPLRIFAPATPEREQRGYDPNGNVCRGNEEHKKQNEASMKTSSFQAKVQPTASDKMVW